MGLRQGEKKPAAIIAEGPRPILRSVKVSRLPRTASRASDGMVVFHVPRLVSGVVATTPAREDHPADGRVFRVG
jgi:hypothetical protein